MPSRKSDPGQPLLGRASFAAAKPGFFAFFSQGVDLDKCICVHAEANALLQAGTFYRLLSSTFITLAFHHYTFVCCLLYRPFSQS